MKALHQVRAHGAADDAAELPLFTGFILEIVPPAGALAEERERGARRPVRPAQTQRLPGVAALVSQNLADARAVQPTSRCPAGRVVQAASGNAEGIVAPC